MEYLSELEFAKELAKLAAAFPHFKPTELTWEVYWNDLHWIPAKKIRTGMDTCRMTGTFFPSVAELIKASIGTDYHAVDWNPHRPATLQDIIRAFKADYRIEKDLLPGASREELPGPTKT